tara:strand:- start:57 stop:641 length:585 start_codon:yes stop_codon:yes gene_type:complete
MPYDKNKIYPEYKIYKLCSDNCDDYYVGSTRDFTTRKSSHKSCCNKPTNKEYNTKKYQTIREFGGWDEWRMVVLEILNNVTKLQAEIREEQLRVQIKAMLNSQRATRGNLSVQDYKKKYREENSDHLKEHEKRYREEHREQKKEYDKEYRENNKKKKQEKFDCECGGKYTHNHKSKHFKTKIHKNYLNSLENET